MSLLAEIFFWDFICWILCCLIAAVSVDTVSFKEVCSFCCVVGCIGHIILLVWSCWCWPGSSDCLVSFQCWRAFAVSWCKSLLVCTDNYAWRSCVDVACFHTNFSTACHSLLALCKVWMYKTRGFPVLSPIAHCCVWNLYDLQWSRCKVRCDFGFSSVIEFDLTLAVDYVCYPWWKIRYFAVASLVGFYSSSLSRALRPEKQNTAMTKVNNFVLCLCVLLIL